MIGLWGPQSLMSKNISPIDADFANIFFKPIAHYLSNPETAEVMVNAHDDIWVEDDKGLWKAPETFTQDALVSAVNSLAQYVGRPIMENVFSIDARMPDGSRVCIVLPPISGKDPIFAIRKFKEVVSDLEFMVKKRTLTEEMVYLIDSCVKIKKNIMVSGGTSSGKTTLLNLIAAKIPDNERILTIEDSRELQLKQEHVLSLEAKPADKYGKGEYTIRQCLKSTLRLRPDRIIVGEIRSGEAFDLIQAMNTGHGGCMGTVHANAPTDTLRRIESLALMADVDMPLIALRSMVASALDLIICPARLSDGSRRIVQIAEIGPLTEKGDYQTVDICKFVSTKRDKNTGKIDGYFEFTGHVPAFFDMFEAEGVDVPREFFRKRVSGSVPPEVVPKLLERGYEVPGYAIPEPKPETRFTNIPFEAPIAPLKIEKQESTPIVKEDIPQEAVQVSEPEIKSLPVEASLGIKEEAIPENVNLPQEVIASTHLMNQLQTKEESKPEREEIPDYSSLATPDKTDVPNPFEEIHQNFPSEEVQSQESNFSTFPTTSVIPATEVKEAQISNFEDSSSVQNSFAEAQDEFVEEPENLPPHNLDFLQQSPEGYAQFNPAEQHAQTQLAEEVKEESFNESSQEIIREAVDETFETQQEEKYPPTHLTGGETLDTLGQRGITDPETLPINSAKNIDQPRKPSILERLSKLGDNLASQSYTPSSDEVHSNFINPQEAETQASVHSGHLGDHFAVQENNPFEQDDYSSNAPVQEDFQIPAQNFAQEENQFESNIVNNQSTDEVAETPNNNSFDDYAAPSSIDFEEDTVINPNQPSFNQEFPQQQSPNSSQFDSPAEHLVPEPSYVKAEAETQSEAQSSGVDNKQHAVIAEILRRMRENKTGEA